MSTGPTTKRFCDVGAAFRDWIISLESINLDPCSVVKDHTIENCSRPAIWYEVVDSVHPECLEIEPIYIPEKVFIDLEVHGDDPDAVGLIFGNLCHALTTHPAATADFDFDGTTVAMMEPSNHDSSYEPKAVGSRLGDYVFSIFVEITT